MREYSFTHFLKRKHGITFSLFWTNRKWSPTHSMKGFPIFSSFFSIGYYESRDTVGRMHLQAYMKY